MSHYPEARFGTKCIVAYALNIFAGSLLAFSLISCSSISDKRPAERLSLIWDTHPQPVDGYQVFKGMTPDVNKMMKVLEVEPENGNTQTVTWTFEELNVARDQQVCFRVKAFNSEVISDFSEAVCTNL